MADIAVRSERKFPCHLCPLMDRKVFRDYTKRELDFVAKFKKGELTVDKGATILSEGARNPHLFTVLVGWGFRYKLMPDGRRQIVNYIMPGDLIGLQGSLMGEMLHSVEALSPMILCVFERAELMNLYQQHPELAYDVTWLAAREESMLDENLLSVGRRTATERVAYLIAFIASRAAAVGLMNGKPVAIPITQQHIADTLGLSLVHTNKTIRKLIDRNLLIWRDRGCEVPDIEALKDLARWDSPSELLRPFI